MLKGLISRLVIPLMLSFSAIAATAAPVQLQFTKSLLPNFLSVLYGDILQRPYVLSPDLVISTRVVTLAATVLPEKLPLFLAGFFLDQGIVVTDRDGVAYIGLRSTQVTQAAPGAATDASRLGGSVLQTPLPLATSKPVSILAPPDTVEAIQPTQSTFARESSEQPPAFVRYAPKNLPPEDLCRLVVKVFGGSSCLDGGGIVHLVHPRFLSTVEAFAAAVDSRPASVDLSMTFVEVTGSRRDGFGLSLVASVLGNSLGLQLGTVADSGVLSLKGTSFSVILDVLRTDTRFRQVASPSGLVDSGKPFFISIGDEVPTLSGQSRDATGQVTNQVTYRPSGVILNVTPVVVDIDGAKPRVVATVDAQVSSFSVTKTGVNSSPTLSKRQVKTQASIEAGEVVVIGGLTGSNDASQNASLWGVRLANRDEVATTELILLLTARTVSRKVPVL